MASQTNHVGPELVCRECGLYIDEDELHTEHNVMYHEGCKP